VVSVDALSSRYAVRVRAEVIERREFVRRIFAMGAGIVAGKIVRAWPQPDPDLWTLTAGGPPQWTSRDSLIQSAAYDPVTGLWVIVHGRRVLTSRDAVIWTAKIVA
jgi:hypothetical protein